METDIVDRLKGLAYHYDQHPPWSVDSVTPYQIRLSRHESANTLVLALMEAAREIDALRKDGRTKP